MSARPTERTWAARGRRKLTQTPMQRERREAKRRTIETPTGISVVAPGANAFELYAKPTHVTSKLDRVTAKQPLPMDKGGVECESAVKTK